MVTQEVQRWRLGEAGLNHFSKMWGVANAFPSPEFISLDAVNKARMQAEDAKLMMQRYRTSYSLLEGQGGHKAILINGSGAALGDISAPQMFGW